MLMTVARSSFGSPQAETISYPDDIFNRFWQPFKDYTHPIVASQSNVSSTAFWNIPPQPAFTSAITNSRGKNITLNWPPFPLSTGLYYIALYFQDSRNPSPYSWRVLDVYINGHIFFRNMNVTQSAQAVVATDWPLSGQTAISLSPVPNSPAGPIINAAELLQLLPFGNTTLTRDSVAIEEVRKEFGNPPHDWAGDPCLPLEHSWNGDSCTAVEPYRVLSLWLGGNKLSGPIPDLSPLKALTTLHLENNQFEGSVPSSLGELPHLQQLFLQNNKLNSSVPETLSKRDSLSVRLA